MKLNNHLELYKIIDISKMIEKKVINQAENNSFIQIKGRYLNDFEIIPEIIALGHEYLKKLIIKDDHDENEIKLQKLLNVFYSFNSNIYRIIIRKFINETFDIKLKTKLIEISFQNNKFPQILTILEEINLKFYNKIEYDNSPLIVADYFIRLTKKLENNITDLENIRLWSLLLTLHPSVIFFYSDNQQISIHHLSKNHENYLIPKPISLDDHDNFIVVANDLENNLIKADWLRKSIGEFMFEFESYFYRNYYLTVKSNMPVLLLKNTQNLTNEFIWKIDVVNNDAITIMNIEAKKYLCMNTKYDNETNIYLIELGIEKNFTDCHWIVQHSRSSFFRYFKEVNVEKSR